MSKALYRKYRSRSLAELKGQPHITTALENAISSGKISHAYLFVGPRGTGKTSVARILAHAINQFDYQLEDDYLDIIEIDAASNTGVDNIRDLREKALITPAVGKYKVYIIDEVHMLSKSAFNALLKTLEEPPAHTVFIMATTDAHKVPVTITSRAQVFTFKLASPEIMQEHLRKIADAEEIAITDEALALIAKRGGGSFRDSISLLDQISTLQQSDASITIADINSALGLPTDQTIQQLLTLYSQNHTNQLVSTLQELLQTGLKPEVLAEELIKNIIDHPNPTLIPLLSTLSEVPRHPFPIAGLLVSLVKPTFNNTNSSPQVSSPQPSIISHSSSFVNTAPASPSNNSLKSPPSNTSATPVNPPKITPPRVTPPQPTFSPSSSPSIKAAKSTNSPTPLQPTLQPPVTADTFNWQIFLTNVKTASMPLFTQLEKASYQLQGDQITIFPASKIAKSLLASPNNQKVIVNYLGNLVLHIADPTPHPSTHSAPSQSPRPHSTINPSPNPTSPTDPLSAIMGAVKEVSNSGDVPDIPA